MPPQNPGRNSNEGARGRASWRGGSGGSSPGASYRWQKDPTQLSERERRRKVIWHRVRVASLSILAVGLIGFVLAKALFFPKKTPIWAVAVTDYASPFPPNAWAVEDQERLATLELRNLSFTSLPQEVWTSSDKIVDDLCGRLAKLDPGGPSRNVGLLYLSVHGAVNGKGEPCLLPTGANPLDSTTWLPVRELLTKICEVKECSQVHKVVLLDCNRFDADWRWGVLYNSFAERLQAVVEELNLPQLVVVNSTGPGQVNWASAELNGSAFGYFAAQGLAGRADVERSGDSDGRVSLSELND